MPRQPLPHFRKDPEKQPAIIIRLGTSGLLERPLLAVYIAVIVTSWALVEVGLSALFATYAGSGLDSAVGVYNSVESFAAQLAMLEASAKCVLIADDFLLFQATVAFIRRRYKTRNEMAHWQWGISDEFPDALFTMEPVASRRHYSFWSNITDLRDLLRRGEYGAQVDKSTFIYRKGDFEEHVQQMNKAQQFTESLRFLSGNDDLKQKGRSILIGEPEIEQHFARLRAK